MVGPDLGVALRVARGSEDDRRLLHYPPRRR
jgi:hypothetical protein